MEWAVEKSHSNPFVIQNFVNNDNNNWGQQRGILTPVIPPIKHNVKLPATA